MPFLLTAAILYALVTSGIGYLLGRRCGRGPLGAFISILLGPLVGWWCAAHLRPRYPPRL